MPRHYSILTVGIPGADVLGRPTFAGVPFYAAAPRNPRERHRRNAVPFTDKLRCFMGAFDSSHRLVDPAAHINLEGCGWPSQTADSSRRRFRKIQANQGVLAAAQNSFPVWSRHSGRFCANEGLSSASCRAFTSPALSAHFSTGDRQSIATRFTADSTTAIAPPPLKAGEKVGVSLAS